MIDKKIGTQLCRCQKTTFKTSTCVLIQSEVLTMLLYRDYQCYMWKLIEVKEENEYLKFLNFYHFVLLNFACDAFQKNIAYIY